MLMAYGYAHSPLLKPERQTVTVATGRCVRCPKRTETVCRAVYGAFESFGGNPITEYAKDAMGNAYAADESSSPELKKAIDTVWSHLGRLSAVTLSRITVLPRSA